MKMFTLRQLYSIDVFIFEIKTKQRNNGINSNLKKPLKII